MHPLCPQFTRAVPILRGFEIYSLSKGAVADHCNARGTPRSQAQHRCSSRRRIDRSCRALRGQGRRGRRANHVRNRWAVWSSTLNRTVRWLDDVSVAMVRGAARSGADEERRRVTGSTVAPPRWSSLASILAALNPLMNEDKTSTVVQLLPWHASSVGDTNRPSRSITLPAASFSLAW